MAILKKGYNKTTAPPKTTTTTNKQTFVSDKGVVVNGFLDIWTRTQNAFWEQRNPAFDLSKTHVTPWDQEVH